MEDNIQSQFHKQLRNKYPLTSGLCCHVPNGGLRTHREAIKFKAMGVLPGWPDYQCMIPANGFSGLFIEFKDHHKGTSLKMSLSDHEKRQHLIQDRLRAAGYKVVECISWQEALHVFEAYAHGTQYLQNRTNLLS